MADEAISPFKSREQKIQERELKREAILSAALRLFSAKGFHSASLDELAAQIGIGKPTIYYYLGNKEQVLFECVSRCFEHIQRAINEARQAPGTGLDRLRTCLQLYGEICLSEYSFILRIADELLSPDTLRRWRILKRETDKAMRELVEEGIADGSVEPADSLIIIVTFFGALNGAGRWFASKSGQSAAKTVPQIVDVLIRGLGRRDLAADGK